MFEFKNYDVLKVIDGEDNIVYGMLLMYPDESNPTIIYKDGFDRLSEIQDDIIAVARPKYAWELYDWDNSNLWRDRIVFLSNESDRPTDLIDKLAPNDIVETRGGDIGRIICHNNKLCIIFDYGWASVDDFNANLTNKYDYVENDIIKIARPTHPYETIRVYYKDVLTKSSKIIWEEK